MIKLVKYQIQKIVAALHVLSVEILVLVALFFASLVVFLLLAQTIFKGGTFVFDARAFDVVASGVGGLQTRIMQIFSFLGSHLFLIPAYLLLLAWFIFFEKKKWFSIKIPSVAVTSLTLMLLLKLFFRRPRPIDPLLSAAAGFSFPSGHAFMSVSFYGLLGYILFKHIHLRWLRVAAGLLLCAIVVLIGLSRIYLRVHYASDVLAGFCVGITWLILSLHILSRLEKRSLKKMIQTVGATQ